MITFNYLMAQALIVLNAKLKKENTARRIGGLFRDILYFLQNLLLGVILKGALPDETTIKAVPDPTKGDTYRAIDTSHYWCYDGSKWNDIGEIIPSDIIQKSELGQKFGFRDDVPMSQEAVTLNTLQIVRPNGIIANDGKFIAVSDLSGLTMESVTVDENTVNRQGFIDENGEYVNESVNYNYSRIQNIPAGATNVKVKSFTPTTRARPIAFYDADNNTVLVPDNTVEGAIMDIEIPINAFNYAISKNLNLSPFVGEFYSYGKSIENNNEISVFDVENEQITKTVLKKLSNLDLLDNNSVPNEDKYYLALSDTISQNFIDSRIAIDNSNFTLSGYLNRADGVLVSTNPAYISTDFLLINKFTAVIYPTHGSQTACNIAFYDADKNFISADTISSEGMYVPDNAVYYRLCKFLSNVDYQAYGIPTTQEIAKTEINNSGYIERTNGNINAPSPHGYYYSDFINVRDYQYVIISVSHNSAGACDFAFYDADEKFISANPQGKLIMAKPVNAVYVKVCRNINNDNNYQCILSKGNMISIDIASVLQYKFGTWISRPLHKDTFTHNTRENNITVSLVSKPINIVGAGTNAKNLVYTETYLEQIEMSTNFEVISDNISVWTGKGYNGIKLKSDKIEIYRITSASGGYTLADTINLPFSIVKGGKYTIGFEKQANNVRYYIYSKDGIFEKIYSKTDAELTALMWGAPFFGIENGEVKVYSSTISTKFNSCAKLYIAGDSFIEGSTMVQYGLENRWCAKLAKAIGEIYTVIDGKGGEAINGAFINRFKVTNDWFNTKYVLISLGTNNYGNVAAYKNDMQTLIDYMKGNNQIPILVTCTPRPGANYETTVKVINEWVKSTGEFYIDIHKAVTKPDAPNQFIDGFSLSDGTHLSVLGHNASFHQIYVDCPFLFQL